MGYIYEDFNNNNTKDKNKSKNHKGDKDEYEHEEEENKKQESLEEILKRFQRDTKEQTKVLQSKLRTTTDVNGNYNFTNVEDGVYIVLEGVERWWFPVNPILGIQIVEVQNGQQVMNQNFGNKNIKKK